MSNKRDEPLTKPYVYGGICMAILTVASFLVAGYWELREAISYDKVLTKPPAKVQPLNQTQAVTILSASYDLSLVDALQQMPGLQLKAEDLEQRMDALGNNAQGITTEYTDIGQLVE